MENIKLIYLLFGGYAVYIDNIYRFHHLTTDEDLLDWVKLLDIYGIGAERYTITELTFVNGDKLTKHDDLNFEEFSDLNPADPESTLHKIYEEV